MAGSDQDYLLISYSNLQGQTGFTLEKQYQVEEFLKYSNILHLQDANIDDDTFCECYYIETNCTMSFNNAENKYGTT
jgi:hypothetical protein